MRSISILILLILSACRTNTVPPEEAAQKFASDLGYKIQGKPNCTGIDTDDDGYVSCTIAVVDHPEATPRMVSLQCACSGDGCYKYASGCKETQPKITPKSE